MSYSFCFWHLFRLMWKDQLHVRRITIQPTPNQIFLIANIFCCNFFNCIFFMWLPLNVSTLVGTVSMSLLFSRYLPSMSCQQSVWMTLNFVKVLPLRWSQLNDKIGKNILTSRLTILNNQIEYDWVNKSLNCFKVICKCLFLTW